MNCEIPYSGLPVYGRTEATYTGINAVYLPENTASVFAWVWESPKGNAGTGVSVWVEINDFNRGGSSEMQENLNGKKMFEDDPAYNAVANFIQFSGLFGEDSNVQMMVDKIDKELAEELGNKGHSLILKRWFQRCQPIMNSVNIVVAHEGPLVLARM